MRNCDAPLYQTSYPRGSRATHPLGRWHWVGPVSETTGTGSRGTRPLGRSTWQPRRCRDPPPRTIRPHGRSMTWTKTRTTLVRHTVRLPFSSASPRRPLQVPKVVPALALHQLPQYPLRLGRPGLLLRAQPAQRVDEVVHVVAAPPERALVETELPRCGRGVAATRLLGHYPRRSRGVPATRLRNIRAAKVPATRLRNIRAAKVLAQPHHLAAVDLVPKRTREVSWASIETGRGDAAATTWKFRGDRSSEMKDFGAAAGTRRTQPRRPPAIPHRVNTPRGGRRATRGPRRATAQPTRRGALSETWPAARRFGRRF